MDAENLPEAASRTVRDRPAAETWTRRTGHPRTCPLTITRAPLRDGRASAMEGRRTTTPI